MKRLNKKGFTLIELLAVIVVLSIILVITVPIVLNTLGSTRQEALQASADTAVKYYNDRLAMAMLGQKQSGFIVDATLNNTTGKLNPQTVRCISVEEADILGLNTTDYSINTGCKETVTNNLEDTCYKNTVGYSTVKWNSSGISTVKLVGKAGGKFESGNKILTSISSQAGENVLSFEKTENPVLTNTTAGTVLNHLKINGNNNLFNIKAHKTATSSGITMSAIAGNNYFTLNGTATKSTNPAPPDLGTFSAGTYKISVKGLNKIGSYTDRIYVVNANDSKDVIINNIMPDSPKEFSLATDKSIKIVGVIASGSTYNNQKVYVNIEKVNGITEIGNYDSATGKYIIPITVSGKNLFNKKNPPVTLTNTKISVSKTETGVKVINPKVDNASNAYYASVYKIDSVENIGANTIYLSADVELNGVPKTRMILGYVDENGGNRKTIKGLMVETSGKYTISMEVDTEKYAGQYLGVWLYSVYSSTSISLEEGAYSEYSNVMLSIGESKYEPYQTAQAYEIKLTEPLRSNGEKSDYIDYETRRVVRWFNSDGTLKDSPTEDSDVELPAIVTLEGTTILSAGTTIKPVFSSGY